MRSYYRKRLANWPQPSLTGWKWVVFTDYCPQTSPPQPPFTSLICASSRPTIALPGLRQCLPSTANWNYWCHSDYKADRETRRLSSPGSPPANLLFTTVESLLLCPQFRRPRCRATNPAARLETRADA